VGGGRRLWHLLAVVAVSVAFSKDCKLYADFFITTRRYLIGLTVSQFGFFVLDKTASSWLPLYCLFRGQ
jgi:enoyl-[acyl-carrier-protein] reductase (NADH)